MITHIINISIQILCLRQQKWLKKKRILIKRTVRLLRMKKPTRFDDTKFSDEFDSNTRYALVPNRDGRYQWKCDSCHKYQHPDHEMTRSIYYHFHGNDGPNFCGYHCMMDYREDHDAVRFDTKSEYRHYRWDISKV